LEIYSEGIETYTTVSAVCSSTLLRGLVDLNVLNDQVAGIETFGVCVCLGVLEETKKELGGFDWPSGPGNTELLAYNHIPSIFFYASIRDQIRTLCSTSSSSSISSHWDGLLVLLNILKELDGSLELPAIDSCITLVPLQV
jgi:hypothetical protein